MYKKEFILSVVLIILFISSTLTNGEELFSEIDHNNNLKLGNDYVVIVVNRDKNAQGRFAIETTGGAPFQDNDNNKPLIYGRPKPWTSYTTIWLDGEHYIFGGETGRRAGAGGNYGNVVKKPHIDDGFIKTVTEFDGKLLVEQSLQIVKSSTTGLYDSVQIKYRVENINQKDQKIGLRMVLDTMLGENDGAPFRIADEAVTTDKIYYKKELPQFWQAFDSISNPTVTSQGNFLGAGVTPPDQVKFADWGSMADGVWDFDFNPGEEFIRKGEYEIDSAVAMYWVPEFLKPGESRSYITNYGLGGITIVPGLLSLGITSPAEVILDAPDKNIPIVAYVENTSEITAENVRINIELPNTLEVEDNSKNLGDLMSGEIAQVIWNVVPSGANIPVNTGYAVTVEADNTDSNQVIRDINFIGPPNLEMSIEIKEELSVINGRLTPNPFTIEAELYNKGDSPLYDTSIELLLPPGLMLAPKEKVRKYLDDIKDGEKIKIRWRVRALNLEGQLPLAVNIKALHGYQDIKIYEELYLPKLEPFLYFQIQEKEELTEGDYINIDIYSENIDGLELIDLFINYDPEGLESVYVSRGSIFLKDDKYLPWTRPDLSNRGIIQINQLVPTEVRSGTIATMHFKVLNPNKIKLEWDDSSNFIGNRDSFNIILKNLIK